MKVFIKNRGRLKSVEIKKGSVVKDLIKDDEIGVLKVNDKVSHPKKILKQGDVVELVKVVYGG
jgi:sulfur carrier protein ThiS